MDVCIVAFGKDRLTHLQRMYGLRERAGGHGGRKGHQGAPATTCMCVSSSNDLLPLPLWSPGRLWTGIGTPITQTHVTLGAQTLSLSFWSFSKTNSSTKPPENQNKTDGWVTGEAKYCSHISVTDIIAAGTKSAD